MHGTVVAEMELAEILVTGTIIAACAAERDPMEISVSFEFSREVSWVLIPKTACFLPPGEKIVFVTRGKSSGYFCPHEGGKSKN